MQDHESVMSIHPKRRGPGRPRDLAKREAIMDAAYALFHERGTATTMDAVAERASVSKMTVYANFRDKPALLSAVTYRRIKLMHVFDLAVGPDLESSVERLVELGEQVASAASQPEGIRMVRLMMECADEHPRIAAAFYTAGRGEVMKQVAAFLKTLTRRGFLSIKDPELAAEQLVVSWLASSGGQGFGLAGPPSADAIARRVRYSVDTLVRAWSPRPPSKSR
jgi:TetR/AcrR family transcriptional regulator, mexJK operon transcriptional repressor